MRATRKAAIAALRLWGACQAARTFTGTTVERRRAARLMEALRVQPRADTEAGRDAFLRLTPAEVISGSYRADEVAISSVPVRQRQEIATAAIRDLKVGFSEGPKAGQPYAHEARTSILAQNTVLAVDVALYGAQRELGLWVYAEGGRVGDFRSEFAAKSRDAYRLHDQAVASVVRAIDVPELSIAEAWAERLGTRLTRRSWSSMSELISVMMEELWEIQQGYAESLPQTLVDLGEIIT